MSRYEIPPEMASPFRADGTMKIAPVQRYAPGIPWDMHLRAYDAYARKWGPQLAMIDYDGRNCRGGFCVDELDDFIPGWRDELATRSAK